MEQIPATRLSDEWKATLSAKKLGIVVEEEEPPKPMPVQQAWEVYKEARRKVQETKQQQ